MSKGMVSVLRDSDIGVEVGGVRGRGVGGGKGEDGGNEWYCCEKRSKEDGVVCGDIG